MNTKKRTAGEIEGFIDMLRAACEDKIMNETLRNILSLPDEKRKKVVLMLVDDLKSNDAPKILIEAISCLVDDAIAEKAYEVVYQCSR